VQVVVAHVSLSTTLSISSNCNHPTASGHNGNNHARCRASPNVVPRVVLPLRGIISVADIFELLIYNKLCKKRYFLIILMDPPVLHALPAFGSSTNHGALHFPPSLPDSCFVRRFVRTGRAAPTPPVISYRPNPRPSVCVESHSSLSLISTQ
jgi:hypothetical protein